MESNVKEDWKSVISRTFGSFVEMRNQLQKDYKGLNKELIPSSVKLVIEDVIRISNKMEISKDLIDRGLIGGIYLTSDDENGGE